MSIFTKGAFSIYLALAAFVVLFYIAFFGYAIAHGGEYLFYLVIIFGVAVLSIPAIWLYKRAGERASILKYALVITPVLLLSAPLIFLFIIKPKSEHAIFTEAFRSFEISNISEAYLYLPDGKPIGLEITYDLNLNEQGANILNSQLNKDDYTVAQFFPENSIIDSRTGQQTYLDNAGTSGTDPSLKVLDYYALPVLSGVYKFKASYLPQGIRLKDGKFCKNNQEDNPNAEKVKLFIDGLFSESSGQFKLRFLSRIHLSNRMGWFDYNFPDYALKTKLPAQVIKENINSLETCLAH